MYEYKEEIIKTRVGSLGSSDAKILEKIASANCVPKSAYKRLAVCKGLIPPIETAKTIEMEYGDFVENQIYEMLKSQDERYESNPCFVSRRYSYKNCTLLTHPDIVLRDNENKILKIYEVKASRYTTEQVRRLYNAQLFIHTTLAYEYAGSLGKNWKVQVYLVHYDTSNINFDEGENMDFNAENITISRVNVRKLFDLNNAMQIVDNFLETFDSYFLGDEIDADYLPERVKEQFDVISNTLKEIKEREEKVDDFKKKLYAFMQEHGIKSVKNDVFTVTRIDGGEIKTFDTKKYLEDMMQKHPTLTKKLKKQYEKISNRNGYVQIRIK